MKGRLPVAALLPAAAGLLCIGVVGPLLLLAVGADVGDAVMDAVEATLLSGYGVFQVLFKATPLVLCGLAVAIPLGAGLFNVGAEGQALAGGLACASVAHALAPAGAGVAFVAGMAAAMLGGGMAGAAPGYLLHRFGVHEVIGTIMFNFILAAGCGWLMGAFLEDAGTAHTPEVPGAVLFVRLSTWFDAAQGSSASTSLLWALGLAALMHAVMARTTLGFELRAAGGSPAAARHAGIPAARMRVGALALGGALAGVAGAHLVLGARRFFEEGMVGGDGFLGIAVALMARSQPLAVVPAALVFAALSQAGLSLGAQVPREVVQVLQGLVVLVLGGTAYAAERMQRNRASCLAAVSNGEPPPSPPATPAPTAASEASGA